MWQNSISILQLFKVLHVVVLIVQSVNGYNLSPKPNVVLKDPQLSTPMPKYESSYFGYSLTLRSKG